MTRDLANGLLALGLGLAALAVVFIGFVRPGTRVGQDLGGPPAPSHTDILRPRR